MDRIKGKIIAICTSEEKGTAKRNIITGNLIENHGFEGDAHAGNWHRQVSLLSYDKVNEFREKGANVEEGAFGENILVEGINCSTLPIGTRLYSGEIILEVTQIGKECHSHCTIFQQIGDCIMPREGIFTRVLKGGKISKGDFMYVEAPV